MDNSDQRQGGYIDFTNYEKLQQYNSTKRQAIDAMFKRWAETPVRKAK